MKGRTLGFLIALILFVATAPARAPSGALWASSVAWPGPSVRKALAPSWRAFWRMAPESLPTLPRPAAGFTMTHLSTPVF